MRLKSYFVYTMEEALQAAKVELGDDAMLVDSKRLETPLGGRARLEVIFAAPVAPPPPPRVVSLPPALSPGSIAGFQRFRGELTNLLEALNHKPDASRLEPMTPARPQLEALRAQLLLSETPAAVVEEVVQRCRPVLEGLVLRGGPALEEFERSLQPLLAAEWHHPKAAEKTPARILAFVGPTGAGKTSAIAKLAFRLGVSPGRPVSVLSIDNLRIGASDQLAHLCSLLGVPFQSLEYSGGIGAALASSAHGGLVLVDTPGYGPAQGDVMEETAWHLARVGDRECHLVLPATMRYSELQRRQRQFAPFSPSRLLFTRLDETEFFGPAWAFSRESGMPVDWVSTGPGIPEDIEKADASKFAAAVLGIAQQATALARAARAGGRRI